MIMKTFFPILSLTVLLVSCGPSRHAIPVEMRYPSKSGLELSAKVVSVVYANVGDAEKDMINRNMADAFAGTLEKEYSTGEGSVGLYSVNGRGADYSAKDSLFNILIDTGADMVFLFDTPKIERQSAASRSLAVTLYCYDGMDKEEKVHAFTGSTVMTATDMKGTVEEAYEAGKRVAEPFFSQWKQEQYSIAYYDGVKWYEALMKAEQYDWKGAMDIWLSLLDSNDMMKRACAEYNIAVACYMLGDFDLAGQWLDRSDEENRMPTLSDSLHKRIKARKR